MTSPESAAPIRPRKAPAPTPTPVDNGQAPTQPVAVAQAERLAPWSLEAEQSVLGAILIDRSALEAIGGLIEPGSFYRQTHVEIFTSMLALHRSETPIDLVTLGDELRRTQRLQHVGGTAYLAELMNSVPTALHVDHYARIVAMKALARRAITDAGRIAAMGYEDANNPDELLSRLRSTVDGIFESWNAGVTATPSLALPDIGPPDDPDTFLVDNLVRPGTTVMLAGPPGAAKSWAARQLALSCGVGSGLFLDRYAIDRRLNVLVVDEDNGPAEEWRREESLLAALNVERASVPNVRRVSLEGVQLDTEAWQRWLRSQVRQHELDLVVLDPISEFHGGKELREDPAFRSMLAFLKRLKVDFPHLATVVVHHTRKLDPKDRSAHRGLEDVRGQWGQTPDVVIVMSPQPEHRIKWEVHKRVPHSSLLLMQAPQGEAGQGSLRYVADEEVMKARSMANDDRVIDGIRGGLTTFKEIQIGISMPPGTLSGVLNRLIQAGVVAKDGRTYSVPEGD